MVIPGRLLYSKASFSNWAIYIIMLIMTFSSSQLDQFLKYLY